MPCATVWWKRRPPRSMAGIAQGSPIADAQAAFARREWKDALALYAAADRTEKLGPDALRAYGESAWWSGRPEDAIGILERLCASHLEAGDEDGAALAALELCDHNGNRRADTLAAAWFARAEKLFPAAGDPKAYGMLLIQRARIAGDTGDVELAIATMKDALALGERIGDRDIQALALMYQGLMKIAMGDVRGGMPLVDEGTMGAVSGDLGLMTSGIVYCCTISACRDISDYRRASDWTEAAHRWCERQSVTGFPGVCRVHRAEITALRGSLAKAEQEARVACDELMKFQITPIAAEGFYEIGSIRLRMGDLPAAEEAFQQAHAMGRSPEPGLSLIRLAEGKAQVANASLKRALAEDPTRPGRLRLLPAQVEVGIATGDIGVARVAAEELAEIANAFGTLAANACARQARGAVLLAE